MTKEERFEQIERYLRQEMTPDERLAFEASLNADPSLKEEVSVHAGVQDLARRQQFLQTLSVSARDHFAADTPQTAGGRQRRIYWNTWLMAAAAVVLLLIVAGIFLIQTRADKLSSEEIYLAYFKPYEVPTALRSEGPIYADADAQQAFSRYGLRDYAGAIPFFSKVLGQSGDNMLLVFSRGNCYLATGDTQQAAKDFNAVIGNDNNLFVDQARWYLALTYIKAGDTDAARAVLRTVQDARAKTLLREIE